LPRGRHDPHHPLPRRRSAAGEPEQRRRLLPRHERNWPRLLRTPALAVARARGSLQTRSRCHISAFRLRPACPHFPRSRAMCIRAALVLVASALALVSFAADSGRIVPGDRLEVRFWGPNLGGTELRVVQSNGTIRLGDSTLLHVQGKTTDEA